MADVEAEVAKLKEIFEFGFITQAEYEDRLRALGVEIPSTSNNGGAGDTQPTTDYSSGYSHDFSQPPTQTYDSSQPSTDYSSGYTHDSSLSYDTSYGTSNAGNSHSNFNNDVYSTGVTSFDISNFNNDTYSHSNDDTSYQHISSHDIEENTYHENNHNHINPNNLNSNGDASTYDIIPPHPHDNNYQENNYQENNYQENNYQENNYHENKIHKETEHKPTNQFANFPQKIFKAAPPPPNNLRTDTDLYFSDSYYFDTSMEGVVVYMRNVRGLFQTAPLTNPTLRSILSDFGITYGKLLRLSSSKEDSGQDIFVPEYDLDATVPPGHYMLAQGYSMIERGSWQSRTDRAIWQHSFTCFDAQAFKDYILEISRKLSGRWGYESNSNHEFKQKTLNYTFSGEKNPHYFIPHFFMRLRSLEAKWARSHSAQAVKKLKQCEQEHLCYFCGEESANGSPFCNNHSDDVLNKLFEHLRTSKNVWEQSFTADEEARAQKLEELQQFNSARQTYEAFISQKQQYRYLDPAVARDHKLLNRCKDRNL